jgi:hypothetical protein
VRDYSLQWADRATLVRDVFQQCVDARLEFNAVLKRCAEKGWPDKKSAIAIAFRAQEAMLKRLIVRMNYLLQHGSFAEAGWSAYTTTALVQRRLQEGWTDSEEAALARSDPAYAALQDEIANVRTMVAPAALDDPYEMAKRDPELIAAGHELNDKVWELDKQLSRQA